MADQLTAMVECSGLTPAKAQVILDTFRDYFALAADWEQKAKSIVVTRADQTAEMAMARQGRLFLKEKRLTIEKTRKDLKEQSLREGKAIDGIANVLKSLIVPLEEYLERQEKYVELKAAAEEAARRAEIEARMEQERREAEEAERQRLAKVEAENKRLRAEAEKKERERQQELAKIRAEEAAREKERQAELARVQAERDREAKKAVRLQAEKRELKETIKAAKKAKCPKCGTVFDVPGE